MEDLTNELDKILKSRKNDTNDFVGKMKSQGDFTKFTDMEWNRSMYILAIHKVLIEYNEGNAKLSKVAAAIDLYTRLIDIKLKDDVRDIVVGAITIGFVENAKNNLDLSETYTLVRAMDDTIRTAAKQ